MILCLVVVLEHSQLKPVLNDVANTFLFIYTILLKIEIIFIYKHNTALSRENNSVLL